MIVDFHSHTLESDGTFAPSELAAAMRARGVEIFSITDHDTLGAYARFEPATGQRVVHGVEINTTYRGNEVHVLGYGFPLDSEPVLAALAFNRSERELRAKRMAEQLTAGGYELTFADVRAEAESERTTLGRPHVARALVRKHYVRDVEVAFRDLLARGRPGYVEQRYVRPQEAIALINAAGGVSVLAHPCRLKDEAIVEELAEAGLQGLEAFYPRHDASQVAHYRALAARLGLVMTAGSDFHDARYNARGVGMDVDRADLEPFFERVL